MIKSAPKPQIILDYKMAFGEPPPDNILDILIGMDRKSVLYELSALNYRLKPKDEFYEANGIEFQKAQLQKLTRFPNLYRKYAKIAEGYTSSETDYPLLFHRALCAYGIEKILNNSDLADIPEYSMAVSYTHLTLPTIYSV